MYVIVTGCGRVGSQLALFLAIEGHDVVVIDKDPASFSRLGVSFNGITLTGIAFDEAVLKDAGVDSADAIAAVTNFDNTNLMVAEIASRIFHVPVVVSRIYNPEKRRIFSRLGIDCICGTTLVAERMMEKILQRDLLVHQDRPDVGVKVVEFAVPWLGGRVMAGDFEIPGEARILALERSGRQLSRDTRSPTRSHTGSFWRRPCWRRLRHCCC